TLSSPGGRKVPLPPLVAIRPILPHHFAFLAIIKSAPMNDPELLTVSQAAEAFSATAQTVRNWIRGDRLHAVRIGTRFLIPRAAACEAAHKDGFEWPATRGGAKPPYELQPGSGRRGPDDLWARFDEAVAELDRVSEGRSMRAVGRAYAEIAELTSALAKAVER